MPVRAESGRLGTGMGGANVTLVAPMRTGPFTVQHPLRSDAVVQWYTVHQGSRDPGYRYGVRCGSVPQPSAQYRCAQVCPVRRMGNWSVGIYRYRQAVKHEFAAHPVLRCALVLIPFHVSCLNPTHPRRDAGILCPKRHVATGQRGANAATSGVASHCAHQYTCALRFLRGIGPTVCWCVRHRRRAELGASGRCRRR